MDSAKLADFARNLDRAYFLDDGVRRYASYDQPLPIGYGQTISQPTLVLEMTYLLSPDKTSRVLEIGTGSGYQTALLAEFAGRVYTVERIPELARKARERLEGMGYGNIEYLVGDGSLGWPDYAPYDRIIATAAARRLPAELLEQLGAGGVMVIPVGPPGVQELLLVTKDGEGVVRSRAVEEVRFVEMKGRYGWTGEG